MVLCEKKLLNYYLFFRKKNQKNENDESKTNPIVYLEKV